jgi:MoaA/NifB/PqqE/SkfB family radical SAM enzyme
MTERSRTSAAKRTRLLAAYLKGQPVWCTWQVTPRCASFCAFCEHRAEGGTGELDLDGCLRVVHELEAMGSLLVSLSGGDPFLRADLPEIVGVLARAHFPMLTSHGWSVTAANAAAVWRAGLLAASVTLEDADAARHDAEAGLPGSHARAVAALEALAGTRVRGSQQVNVKVRLKEGSEDRLPALLDLAARLGATVSVEPAFPLPAAGSSGLSARLLRLKAEHPHLRTSPFFLERIDQARNGGVPGCRAARSFFNVDHRGRVSKCVEFRGPEDQAGDLSVEPAAAVLPRLRTHHERNRCQACWMSARGEVEALHTWRGLAGGLLALVRP